MRDTYMAEYQFNLDQNTSRRDDKLTEISIEIETQNTQMNDLELDKQKLKSCFNGFIKKFSDEKLLRRFV
jgi:hypothetical protein